VVYNADIYRRETAAAFRERYLELLAQVADRPDATLETLTATSDSAAAALLQRLADGPAPVSAAVVANAATAAAHATGMMSPLLLPEQAQLAQIWASSLNIDVNDIRASDNFFDLGGDSLLAMRITQQAEQVMGFRVEPRRYVFENLGQLAAAEAGIKVELVTEAAPVKRGLLGRVLGWGRKD
jgi:acyl carrier protein